MIERGNADKKEGFEQWEVAVDDIMSVWENMETTSPELPFGLSEKFSSFFSDKYDMVSGKVVEKWEDIREDAKAWKERNIRKPTKEGTWLAAKKIGRFGMDVTTVSTNIVWKIVKGLFKFTKDFIKNKGKMTFSEGYEIGGEMFSFDEGKKKGK